MNGAGTLTSSAYALTFKADFCVPHATLLYRGDEPEPLKRLKREMGVALHEEDYVAAGNQSVISSPNLFLHGFITASSFDLTPKAESMSTVLYVRAE